MNEASKIPSSLPSGALAPGTLVRVMGARLGRHPTVLIKSGELSLKGTLVSTTDVSAVFLMPAALSNGEASLTIDAEGGRSRPFPIRILQAAFGIESLRYSGGWLTLEGTGIGNAVNLEANAGGVRIPIPQAAIQRSAAGHDTIHIQLPPQVPSGCHVPVYVRMPGYVSNFVELADRKGCRDLEWPLLPPSSKGRAGSVVLLRSSLTTVARSWTVDSMYGMILAATTHRAAAPPMWFPLGAGQCRIVYQRETDPFQPLRISPAGFATVNVGGFLTIGDRRVPVTGNGMYTSTLGGESIFTRRKTPLFFTESSYRIESPAGLLSANIAFRDDLEFPVLTEPIDRTKDLHVRWKTSATRSIVVMGAQGLLSNSEVVGMCAVEPGSSDFSIPAEVLASLPASQKNPAMLTGFIGVAALEASVPFQARGMRQGVASTIRMHLNEVEFR